MEEFQRCLISTNVCSKYHDAKVCSTESWLRQLIARDFSKLSDIQDCANEILQHSWKCTCPKAKNENANQRKSRLKEKFSKFTVHDAAGTSSNTTSLDGKRKKKLQGKLTAKILAKVIPQNSTSQFQKKVKQPSNDSRTITISSPGEVSQQSNDRK